MIPSVKSLLPSGTHILQVEGDSKNVIDQALYENLVHYFKYACCAYTVPEISIALHLPTAATYANGAVLVGTFRGPVTDLHGYVARDDTRKEIIVAFRGSASPANFVVDATLAPTAYDSPGIALPEGTTVHLGFLVAWNTIAESIYTLVSEQLTKYPDYAIITSGHSLGGALSTIAAPALKIKFKDVREHRTYSYGSPRVGNKIFADYIDKEFGPGKAFRVVHNADGVPTMLLTQLGYRHHGPEYWQHPVPDVLKPISLTRLFSGGEHPSGSASIPTGGINAFHVMYFGIFTLSVFCN